MKKLIALLTVTVLGACSSTSEVLFADNKTKPETNKTSNGFDGTFMKSKIENFNAEQSQLKKVVESRKIKLQDMRNETNTAVSDYRNTISQINTKLQQGTTPGNPELMDEWKQARSKIEKVNNIAFDIKRLVADVESDQSMVDYMVGSIQASYKIRGATEEDHKKLKALEEEAKQVGINISLFAKQLNAEADRQQSYVNNEKYNLNDVALNIKNGNLYGLGNSTDFFANGGSMFSSDEAYNTFLDETRQDYGYAPSRRDVKQVTPVASRMPASSINQIEKKVEKLNHPLLVVKFDRENVDYEEPLYQALSRALERNPSATFEVSAISSRINSNSSAKKNVKNIMNSLTEMGLPASRVSLTMKTENIDVDEVRILEK